MLSVMETWMLPMRMQMGLLISCDASFLSIYGSFGVHT
jgi:hypothetical protein